MKVDTAFILCAGEGTRLSHLTADKPKCLVDISGKSVLQRIISWLKKFNVEKFVCNTFYKKEVFRDYVGGLRENIFVSVEDELLGTFAGIAANQEFMENTFLIIYGDVLTNYDLHKLFKFHEANQSDCTIVSYPSCTPWTGGVIESDFNGRIVKITEKPNKNECKTNLINSGIILCNPEIAKRFCTNNIKDVAADFLPAVINNGLRVFHTQISHDEFVIDMGTLENYELAKAKYDSDKNSDAC